jgi:hypothetical protein
MYWGGRILAISLATLLAAASPCSLTISSQAQQLTPATPATLVGPICPGQNSVTVENSAGGATLVLQINNKEQGRRSGGAGRVSLDIADPPHLSRGDLMQVAQQIGGGTTLSNVVVVGCTDVLTYHNNAQRTGWNATRICLALSPLIFLPIMSALHPYAVPCWPRLCQSDDAADREETVATRNAPIC